MTKTFGGDALSGEAGDRIRGGGLIMMTRLLLLSTVRVVCVAFLGLMFLAGTAQAAPCNVPSITYPTIQSAVNDPSCNPIFVAPGLYAENVTINRTVTLLGAQAGNHFSGRTFGSLTSESTVDGLLPSATFTVQAPRVTIDGFSITNPGAGLGVVVKTAGDDALVTNNIVAFIGGPGFTPNTVGIYLEHGPDRVRLLRNWIHDIQSTPSAQGILVGDSTAANPSLNILIAANLIERITSTSGAYGVQVNNGASTASTATGFTTVAIFGNTIRVLSGSWAHAIGLEGDTPNVVVQRNTISDLLDVNPAPINDAIAVFFEANPSFWRGHVNQNNFNVKNLVDYGIAVHPLLSAAYPTLSVDGTCNWWNASNGPGPVGPGSGALVSPNVDYDPWLDAPAPGGDCRGGDDGDDEDEEDGEDDDDHDEDGERDDEDEDDDNDGQGDEEDEDDDNDGERDGEDEDDDNDRIKDDVDSESSRQTQRSSSGTMAGGQQTDFTIVSDGSALPLIGVVDATEAELLRVEIYDPNGQLIGVSPPTPGRALVTAPGLLPGIYTVRVRNTGITPVDYKARMVSSTLW